MIMAKWKCEICNSEFDNFQAQGFNHKIYCPLCYFKELYRQTELERERLSNIINELEKELKEGSFDVYFCSTSLQKTFKSNEIIIKAMLLDKLKEMKEKK